YLGQYGIASGFLRSKCGDTSPGCSRSTSALQRVQHARDEAPPLDPVGARGLELENHLRLASDRCRRISGMRKAPSARLLPIVIGAAALAIGCRQEAPVAPVVATRIAEIGEVNTAGGFVDSIALTRDASRVATGERNGSIRIWAPAGAAENTLAKC